MDISALVVVLTDFALVCLLPFIFFREDGKKNLMWMATAAPYVIGPVIAIALYLDILQPSISVAADMYVALEIIAVLLCLLSIGLMCLTMGTHRIPLALWHQKTLDDKPADIVTWGAYSKICHPFYTSFIILMIANSLLCLHWGAWVLCLYVIFLLNYTAAKEERRLICEPDGKGEQYVAYMQTAGRFFPRLTNA